MTGKRKRYSADFKAKVALEAPRGELTTAQFAAKHGVHQTMISEWKRQAVDGLGFVFSTNPAAAQGGRAKCSVDDVLSCRPQLLPPVRRAAGLHGLLVKVLCACRNPVPPFDQLWGQCCLRASRGIDMRVMVLVKATTESEAGVMPTAELLAAMGRFNDEIAKAGILEAASGLKPSSHGVRVRFSGSARTVIDGPFAETKELVAGYWIWNVGSLEEAIEWVRRCPNPMMSESDVEIRPLFGLDDFGEALTPEARALHEDALRCSKEH